MRALLEQKFFPFVVKPGRYSGGEPGQIVKSPDGRVKYLHCYPDKYEIGQSYVGLQTLYHVVNADDRFLCERAYAVDCDAEELMRREGIPLFSLESSRPAREFDAIGFTLVDEMVATNMLAMIDLAGIPLRAADRRDGDPIVMAGGPAAYNPEPLAPFIDLFFVGDAEEGLPQMLALLAELRGESRIKRLEALAQRVESVYVPLFYDDQGKPQVASIPERIKARVVAELKPQYYPRRPILPLVETVHDHLGVEIMRGCPQGCKFCFAAPIYRPVRPRKPVDLEAQIEAQINETGYDTVSLLSLSATDYPGLEKLALRLSRWLEPRRISLSLPSLRPGSVSRHLLHSLKTIRRSTITIAPEAGTERLRLLIRKDFPDQAIYDTARNVYSEGWSALKMYFMVGLPTETEDDLLGICNLCQNVLAIGREYNRRASVNVTLSPFVPKPHTPFQWDGALSENEMFDRIQFVKRHTRGGQIHFRHNSTQMATISAIIGRGGRELADVVETAFRKGCRFDSWGESFQFTTWLDALAENKIDPAERLKPIPFSARLPWTIIEKGVSSEHLQKERERTSVQLRDYVSPPDDAPAPENERDDAMAWGRGRKRVAGRITAPAPTKNRARLRWSKSARYRYMSHLENLHLMERALRRARWPVMYSQGHNPIMKLSLGPPLPLGFTSETELIDVTLESNYAPHLLENLRKALPEGIEIVQAAVILHKGVSLGAALNRAEYTLPVSYWANQDQLEDSIAATMLAERLECTRGEEEKEKTVNIRPALYGLRLEGDLLVMVLGLGESGYAKPVEVAAFIGEGLTAPVVALPFHRRALYRIESNGRRVDAMDV